MAKKSMVADAKDTIVEAAKTGAEGIKETAGEALGAAAAAGVVLQRVSSALAAGETKVAEGTPAATEAARQAVSRPFKKTRKRAAAKRKATANRKTAAAKKQPAAQKSRKTAKKVKSRKKTKARKSPAKKKRARSPR